MPADLLIYMLIAAGLVFWLRSILGTRHGDERQRPNPFTPPPEPKTATNAHQPPSQTPGEAIIGGPLTLPKNSVASLANQTLEPALMDMARADRDFTLAHFVDGAQDAFVMIIEAFANGDRALLKALLAPDLFRAFDSALAQRTNDGHSMSAEIHAIRKVEIQDAQIKGRTAFLTVRFVADETVILRDKDGNIITGNPDRVSETIDIWTFGRENNAKDPTWYLYATREEESATPENGVPNAESPAL